MTDTDTMTGTQTVPDPNVPDPEPSEPTKRFFDVDYSKVEFLEELPDNAFVERKHGGGGKDSVLEQHVNRIVADEPNWGKWGRMGTYGRPTAAPAAKNVLELRHGKSSSVEGMTFTVRRLKSVDDTGADVISWGLYMKYDPTAIIEGAAAAHELWLEARDSELTAKREQKAAEKAAAEEVERIAAEKAAAKEARSAARAAAQAAANGQSGQSGVGSPS